MPVVNSTQEELTTILLEGPSANIVVLRQPPLPPTSVVLQRIITSDPEQQLSLADLDRGVVPVETTPRRKVVAI